MKSVTQILSLATARIAEAECLKANGHWDAAIYMAGYAIELHLKARICRMLSIPDFFDEERKKSRLKSSVLGRLGTDGSTMYKPFWVHDYVQLVILSGSYQAFESEIKSNPTFADEWAVACLWNEGQRYVTGRNEKDAAKFIAAVKNIALWISRLP